MSNAAATAPATNALFIVALILAVCMRLTLALCKVEPKPLAVIHRSRPNRWVQAPVDTLSGMEDLLAELAGFPSLRDAYR